MNTRSKTLLVSAFFAALCLRAEIIDRVAISIGHQTITELDIDEELRVTALLNGKPLLRDGNSRREAADRLLQQFLLTREMEVSRFPSPENAATNAYIDRIESALGGPAAVKSQLRKYQLEESTLREHLSRQFAVLRFVGLRFRPESSVSDAEIAAFLKQAHSGANTGGLAAASGELGKNDSRAREAARQTLVDQRTDEALNVWLEEARKQYNIVYLDRTLE